MAGVNGNAKWAVWLFRLVISAGLAGVIADRVSVGAQLRELQQDVRELRTVTRIYHPGG